MYMYIFVYVWNLNGVMESSNNAEDNASVRYLIPPRETSRARNGVYLVESLAKGAPGNFQISQAITKDISCSPQTDGKTLLLRVTHTSSNMEKSSWCLTRDFTPSR